MKRRGMLKAMGAVGLGAVLPTRLVRSAIADDSRRGQSLAPSGTCWLTPIETEGPYYFNANLVRQDIRTDVDTGNFHDGAPLTMTITVIDVGCAPIGSVLVDIWHCDSVGLYSGYNQPGGNMTGQDFMRGIQPTDANGQCSFITSYPGWYPGRNTHVHVKIRFNASSYLTSQWCFPDSVNNEVYATGIYAPRGPNPTQNNEDGIFGNNSNPPHQVMDVIPNGQGGYNGTLTIGINTPVEVETPGSVSLDRVAIRSYYPSPFRTSTTVVYFLPARSEVNLCVYDLLGRRVATLVRGEQASGLHEVPFHAGDLASGFYVAKIIAGGATDAKEMLLLR